ncbi:hypothetical protein AB1207_03280 [Kineococcus endophyticus]|uniref:Uncharacterized protein n=1 Tax=Kineococcus endophyticus TaxID=1181883 RepID=A0ABV3P2A4_9ACTN
MIRRGAAVGAVVLVLVAGCSAGAAPDGRHDAQVGTPPVSDHRAELAHDGEVLGQVFQVPADAVGVSRTQVPTGSDTPDGWQVEGFTSVTGADLVPVGAHQVHVACVGTGSLTVLTRPAAGTTASPSPASAPVDPQASSVVGCAPDGVVDVHDLTVAAEDPGVETVVRPAEGTVAVLGYALT